MQDLRKHLELSGSVWHGRVGRRRQEVRRVEKNQTRLCKSMDFLFISK